MPLAMSCRATRQDQADRAAPPRLVVNDVTVEKLGELLNENPRGLLLVRDELHGALSRLDREDYQSERAFYLEAYNGDGSFTFDRIGRGTIHIPCCTLSMIGGIQPSRVSSLVAEAAKGGGSDGLLQRFQLAVWPDELTRLELGRRSSEPSVPRDLREGNSGPSSFAPCVRGSSHHLPLLPGRPAALPELDGGAPPRSSKRRSFRQHSKAIS